MKTYRTGSLRLAAAIIAAVALAAALCFGALYTRALVYAVFGGEADAAQGGEEEALVSSFTLRAEMVSGQMDTRIRGWMSVAPGEQAAVAPGGAQLEGTVYPAVQGGEDAPWALLLGGRERVLDVACMLSLAGYRVVSAELTQEGALDSLGPAEAEHVAPWVDYILARDANARIVLFGQDTGAAAALLAAAEGLDGAVRAVAVDGAHGDAGALARARLTAAFPGAGALEEALLALGYRAAFGVPMEAGDVLARAGQIAVPTLLIHGTGDELVPAWHSENLAAACGGTLLLIEGAAHGMARFVDYAQYESALLAFYAGAMGE